MSLVAFQKNKNISIAVLPFQVTSNDERIKTLFTGFTEDLITNFSKFIGLSVISYYSTQLIKDVTNQSEIDKLSADYLVIGNVRKTTEKYRISIQLVKTEDKSLVFAGQHDETLDSLFDAQDQIIQQIVNVLQEKINYNLLSHSYKKNSVELAAYENYLLGMNTIYKGTADNDIKARKYFEAALKIDSNYSLAYAGISLTYFNFWSCILWDRWDESMKGAHEYALKAIEIDDNDYTALGVLGRTYVYKGEIELAEHCLRKSLRMNPNDASHLLRVSYSLLFLGYSKEAVQLYLKAIEINPLHKDVYYAYGSNYYLQLGDFETSINLSKKVRFNCWTDFPAWVAAAYLQIGNYDKMWECWNLYLEQFESAAYTRKKGLNEEAIEWLSIINPFTVENYLTPLADYIRNHKNIPKEKVEVKSNNPSFQFKGNVWEIRYLGDSLLLKDIKGLHDIYKLISEPNKEFHCMDLMEAFIDESTNEKAIDSKAKVEYQKRIKEIQQEIEDAEEFNNIEALEKLQEEYNIILNHLSKSLGLGGKSRKIGTTIEKTRSAITWRIRNAIKKIKSLHPTLGEHFSKSINTGTYCSYKPDTVIHWEL